MEWCAAVCVPLLQAATPWQVENRIRGVECIIPYACLQFSHTEHTALPDTERLQNVDNPLRSVCLLLFKASPLWDGHFKIVRSGISSAGIALQLLIGAYYLQNFFPQNRNSKMFLNEKKATFFAVERRYTTMFTWTPILSNRVLYNHNFMSRLNL